MKPIGKFAWFLAVVAFVLLPVLLAFASDPRAEASVAVSVSRVRAAQNRHINMPSDFDKKVKAAQAEAMTAKAELQAERARLQAAIDEQLAAISERDGMVADLRQQTAEQNAKLLAMIDQAGELELGGAGKSEDRDIATDGNAGGHPPAKQPDAEWTRPPVLSLTKPITGDLVYDVTMFTGEDQYGRGWCKNCPKAEAKFCPGGGRLRVTKNTAVADGPQIYPAFRFHDASGRSRYPAKANGEYRQPKDPDDLLDIVERNHGGTPAAATGSAGSMKTHGQIRAFIQQWRDRIGDGEEIRCRIDKTGDQRLSVTRLIHGEPWPKKQVCGKFGRVELSTTAKLPLKVIGFTYRLEDDDRFTFDVDPLTFGLPAQGYGANGEAVGMDPVTIGLSIIQIANALYQILNPQIDCILPGTMSFVAKVDGETLTIKFDDAPSIHVSAWLQFDLGVKQVTITPTNVHVGFDAEAQKRNWIRIDSRDFQVDDQ